MNAPRRTLSRWLKATGIVYAVGAVDFTARPQEAIRTLNMTGGAPLDPEPSGIYNALASAYMATIASLALTAAGDPDEHRNLIPPLLVAKATSSAGFLLRFARTRRSGFAYAALVDALLLGVTGGLYAAAQRSTVRDRAPGRRRRSRG